MLFDVVGGNPFYKRFYTIKEWAHTESKSINRMLFDVVDGNPFHKRFYTKRVSSPNIKEHPEVLSMINIVTISSLY
jgi:hypothetical protein